MSGTSCVIYTRFSPRRNADACESAEVQEAYCEQYAAQNGMEVVGVYCDRGVSGKVENRPRMWEAIEAIPRGGVLLVYKRDRLARNVYLEETLKRAVEARGGRIMAVSGDIEGDGPEQVMIRQILSSISEYERKLIGIRTRWAMLDRQRRGQRMGRYAPYGFRLDPQDHARLVTDEREQEALREMRRVWEKSGRSMTPGAVRTHMNAGWSDYSRGAKWDHKTVRKILERFEREPDSEPKHDPGIGVDTKSVP